MVCVVCPRVCNVVQDFLAIESIPLGDGKHSNRSERALSVNVQALALSAAHRYWQLARHCQSMADLRLARPELACGRQSLRRVVRASRAHRTAR